jgi:hypothetical protein
MGGVLALLYELTLFSTLLVVGHVLSLQPREALGAALECASELSHVVIVVAREARDPVAERQPAAARMNPDALPVRHRETAEQRDRFGPAPRERRER